MKFSIIYEAQMVDTSRENEAQVFADMIEQCVLAEEMGFDVIWSVEHHCLTQYAHLSAPESFLAFVAGRTKRIHVGHANHAQPLHHCFVTLGQLHQRPSHLANQATR